MREPFGLQEDRPGGIDDLRMKTGSLATAFVNTWFAQTGVPVVGVSASKGGSRIEEWLPGSRYLTDAIERLRAARGLSGREGLDGPPLPGPLCQGESDGDAGTPRIVYEKRFEQMFSALQRAGVEDCLLIQNRLLQWRRPNIDYAPIRQAQQELCRKLAHVHLVSGAFAGMKARGLMKDAFHYYQQAYNEVGAEAACNAARVLRAGGLNAAAG